MSFPTCGLLYNKNVHIFLNFPLIDTRPPRPDAYGAVVGADFAAPDTSGVDTAPDDVTAVCVDSDVPVAAAGATVGVVPAGVGVGFFVGVGVFFGTCR
jgi:hypothetical protein